MLDLLGIGGKILGFFGDGKTGGAMDLGQLAMIAMLFRRTGGNSPAGHNTQGVNDKSTDENAQRTIQIIAVGDSVANDKLKSLLQGGKCNGKIE